MNDARWAAASGLPKETLSRLRRRASCDLATLVSLASAVGAPRAVLPDAVGATTPDGYFPARFDRDYESRLLDLAASGDLALTSWNVLGPAFFMAGLAVLLASLPGADLRGLLALAEKLHPGNSHPDIFQTWLDRSPVKPSRFVPMLRAELRRAARSQIVPDVRGSANKKGQRVDCHPLTDFRPRRRRGLPETTLSGNFPERCR